MQNWEDVHFSMGRSQCFHLILKGVCDRNKIEAHCDPLFPAEPGELMGRAVAVLRQPTFDQGGVVCT